MKRSIEEIGTKFVGFYVPIPLYREIKAAAERENLSATALYRKALVKYLDKVKPRLAEGRP